MFVICNGMPLLSASLLLSRSSIDISSDKLHHPRKQQHNKKYDQSIKFTLKPAQLLKTELIKLILVCHNQGNNLFIGLGVFFNKMYGKVLFQSKIYGGVTEFQWHPIKDVLECLPQTFPVFRRYCM